METSAVQSLKLTLLHATGLSKDALHIHVGLFIFFVVALAARKRVGNALPLVAVLVAAVTGELFDMRDDLRSLGHWRWTASLHDIVNTVAWPVAISALARTWLITLKDDRALRSRDQSDR